MKGLNMNRFLLLLASILLITTPLSVRADDGAAASSSGSGETAGSASAGDTTSTEAGASGSGATQAPGGASAAGAAAASGPNGADPNMPPVAQQAEKDKDKDKDPKDQKDNTQAEIEARPIIPGFCPSGNCTRDVLGGTGGKESSCDGYGIKGAGPGRETCIGASASSSGLGAPVGGANTQ